MDILLLLPSMNPALFLKKLITFTLTIAILMLLISQFSHTIQVSTWAWAALLYFFLLSLATGLITQSGLQKDNKTFMSRTYGAIGIRFIFSLFPLLIYLLFSNSRDFTLIVIYILLYFFYTSFEIYFLVVNLRPDYKK